MENFKDYYGILRVCPTADDATIKAAFRRLAYRYHPDVASSKRAGRRFPNIQEAYAVLADPEKRREYDRVYRDRKPGSLTLPARPKPRERDGQTGGRLRRLGIALDVLGLRVVGLKVDAGSVQPNVRRRKRSSQ
jgi:curved DNA-binding protein